MAEFIVTANEVQSKAMELQNIAKQIRTKVDEMGAIEKKLSGMWEGDAHDAFHTTYGNDEQKFLLFVNAVEKYALALNEIAVNYHNSEVKNIETAQS
ncbi:MAG: WXG100 family type VII secretion target [Lachnospiraceae bacterium]|nr:WXG100 family type VII secretion target [Lachnospiraceae bacterium]